MFENSETRSRDSERRNETKKAKKEIRRYLLGFSPSRAVIIVALSIRLVCLVFSHDEHGSTSVISHCSIIIETISSLHRSIVEQRERSADVTELDARRGV